MTGTTKETCIIEMQPERLRAVIHFAGEDRSKPSAEGRLSLDTQSLSYEERQKLLMVFVPKKIAEMVHGQNRQVKTSQNLRYGGTADEAPMVTWVFSFLWDTRASVTPDAVYKDCLNLILSAAGYVSDTGQIDS